MVSNEYSIFLYQSAGTQIVLHAVLHQPAAYANRGTVLQVMERVLVCFYDVLMINVIVYELISI